MTVKMLLIALLGVVGVVAGAPMSIVGISRYIESETGNSLLLATAGLFLLSMGLAAVWSLVNDWRKW